MTRGGHRRPDPGRGTRWAVALLLVLALGLALAATQARRAHRAPATASTGPAHGVTPAPSTTGPAVRDVLGPPPAGRGWLSGVWTGGRMSTAAADAFGAWRGRPADVVLTYPERRTYAEVKASSWHIDTFEGFHGRLVYGLPLLPEGASEGTLQDVARGARDDVWTQVAEDLVAAGHGDAIVRIGWEANATWYPWGGTAATAPDYRAAYRHVAKVMRRVAPRLVTGFDVSCGTGLTGSSDRTAALTELYPGDDVVDLVGCDMYDVWKTRAATEEQWSEAIAPVDAVGLADVAAFARAHGKPLVVPEWGLWRADDHGGGDNPFFVDRMHRFFRENSSLMGYEAYFDDAGDYIRASIFLDHSQNPRASAQYRLNWGEKP